MQRMAELTERVHTDADAHTTEEQWSCGEWHDAGFFLVWLAVGSTGPWRGDAMAGGETEPLVWEVENLRGAVFGLWQGQSDVQAGLAAMMGELRSMAGFEAGSWVDVAPRASSKRGADQSPDRPGAKFLAQEIEEDELIAGTGVDARQQQE